MYLTIVKRSSVDHALLILILLARQYYSSTSGTSTSTSTEDSFYKSLTQNADYHG